MSTQVAVIEGGIKAYEMIQSSEMLFDPVKFQQLERFAQIMASGKATVPSHLAGNVGDCMAVSMQAMQWGMNPFSVAQKTHIVNGALGYESQLVNAVITSMSPTKGRLKFDWFGDWDKFMQNTAVKANEIGCGVRVYATLNDENEPRILNLLMLQATVRNSPLWKSDPKQQLAYLGIKKWARLYCPDVIMGVYSGDELPSAPVTRDMGNAVVVENVIKEKTLPDCTDDDFSRLFDKYSDAIARGKTTAENIVSNLDTRCVLSESQRAVFFDIEVLSSENS